MPDISGKLFPNVVTMVVQLCATGLLLFVFKKYFWNYVQEYFAKRADFIEGQINEAKETNKKAHELMDQSEKEARESVQQYRDILEKAKAEGDKAKQQIIDDANEEAKRKIEQARREIETEKMQAQEAMKEEIVSVAVEVATKVMNKEMNTDENKALIEEFCEEVVN